MEHDLFGKPVTTFPDHARDHGVLSGRAADVVFPPLKME
jgi:hypothetical protein